MDVHSHWGDSNRSGSTIPNSDKVLGLVHVEHKANTKAKRSQKKHEDQKKLLLLIPFAWCELAFRFISAK